MSIEDQAGSSNVYEVIERSGRTVVFAGEIVEVRRDTAKAEYVDTILENFAMNGTVHVGLGTLVLDPGNKPLVDVGVRLRMNVVTAQNLVHALTTAINAALAPPDKSSAN